MMVEVDEPGSTGSTGGPGGVTRSGRPAEVVERAQLSFEEALARIKPAADGIIARLRSLSDPPDQIGVEFGLKLSAEAGIFLASASVDANYRVTLTWNRGGYESIISDT
jgi:hypothetical protein